jgi:sugar phosphate isomerase/epimerase
MPITRRRFVGTLGAAAAAASGLTRSLAGEAAKDKLRLGMMLQGDSAADLAEKAKAIARVGFDTVQLTFFFPPTADDLKSLAATLSRLKLKTVAFGTYFNLFRPDDRGFMGSSIATMKLVAAHAELFDCRQFVTWSASYAPQFAGVDPRNHTPEAVAQIQRAIREVLLPVIEPIRGRVAFEPYYPHVVGKLELAKQLFAPFPAERIGLMADPPNYISPDLYPHRQRELDRLFRELGDRIHLAHFKDMKLSANGQSVDLPGPGGGEQDYPRFIAALRKLDRPMPCLIEHIPAEPGEMAKAKAWVEKQLAKR